MGGCGHETVRWESAARASPCSSVSQQCWCQQSLQRLLLLGAHPSHRPCDSTALLCSQLQPQHNKAHLNTWGAVVWLRSPKAATHHLIAASSFQNCCKFFQLLVTNICHSLHLKKWGGCLSILEIWRGQAEGGNHAERSFTKMDVSRKKLYSKKSYPKPFSILCVAKIKFYWEK